MQVFLVLLLTVFGVSQAILVAKYEVMSARLETALDSCAGIKKVK